MKTKSNEEKIRYLMDSIFQKEFTTFYGWGGRNKQKYKGTNVEISVTSK